MLVMAIAVVLLGISCFCNAINNYFAKKQIEELQKNIIDFTEIIGQQLNFISTHREILVSHEARLNMLDLIEELEEMENEED